LLEDVQVAVCFLAILVQFHNGLLVMV
jgi:hypothetical protein